MQVVLDFAPVIGTIISAHCPGTGAKEEFLRACCVHGHWDEARAMVEGMLAEPWHLRGYQEMRLRDFLELLPGGGDGSCDAVQAAPSWATSASLAEGRT